MAWPPGIAAPGGLVTIQLSRDGGQTWTNVVSNLPDSLGTFDFPAAGPASTQCRVRVVAQLNPGPGLDPNFLDGSDGDFTITDGLRQTFAATQQVPTPSPTPIPDNWQGNADWVESKLFLPFDALARGLFNQVKIDHFYQGDLQIWLVPPDAPLPDDIRASSITVDDLKRYAVLLQDQRGSSSSFVPVDYPIPCAYGEPLADARAKSIGKRTRFWDPVTHVEKPWRLLVRDLKPGDIGILNDWSLTSVGPDTTRLRVTFPNGTERLDIGSTQRLTWINDPDNPIAGDVNILLSRDSGLTFPETLNTVPIPADVQFLDWVVTGPVSLNNCVLKVISIPTPVQQDVSDAPFSIENASLTVLNPNGGETVLTGRNRTITWDSVPLSGTVTIKLSTDSGATYPTVISNSAPNTGSFDWLVPAMPDLDTARIQIIANSGPARQDESNTDFLIRTPLITVTNPTNAGVLWYTYVGQTITWTSKAQAGNVRIELSLAESSPGVRTDWQLLGTVPITDGSFPYTPVPPASTTAVIRITAVNDPLVSDVSDNVLEIRNTTITVTRPIASDKLAVGYPFTITWTSEGLPTSPAGTDNVDIEISRNGGPFTALFTNTANDGSQVWNVSGPVRAINVIRVKARNFPVSGLSASFPIVLPSVEVLRPNGGERAAVGRIFQILWNPTPATGTVKISLSLDSGVSYPTVIATGEPNDGSYDWTVPAIPDTDKARIKIEVEGSPFPTQTDTSDNDFIIETPSLRVLAPNGGELWFVNSTQNVRYQTVGVTGDVNIQVSRTADGMGVRTDWTTIGTAPASNDGSFPWVVTGPPSTNCKVRIVSVANPTEMDEGDGAFEIRNMLITVTSPNGGEAFGIGTTRNLTWTSDGVTGRVDILLSRDGGTSYAPLLSNTANDGTEAIVVPGPAGTLCRIKVQSVNFPTFDESDGNFSILNPGISVIAANGGEQLKVNTTFTIRWASVGLSSNVKVELSRNGGQSFQTLFNNEPATGTRDWTVVGPDTTNALFRVTSLELPGVADTSDAPFTIVTPLLTVTAPNGGERWFTGLPQIITWTTNGIDPTANVRIEISTNGGGAFTTLVASTVNDGNEGVVVPQTPSANCKIRLTALDGSGAADSSDAPFVILDPTIRVLNPNGGQEWLTGSRQTITWVTDGVPGNAPIDIFLDGPGGTFQIFSGTANDQSETYTVTAPPGAGYKVRVEWSGRASVTDSSDGTIDISVPALEVTSPATGAKWTIGKQVTITWDGSAVRVGGGQVDIFISRDGGATFKPLILDTRNDGSVTLTASGPKTTRARIRVVWKVDPSVSDDTGDFTIKK